MPGIVGTAVAGIDESFEFSTSFSLVFRRVSQLNKLDGRILCYLTALTSSKTAFWDRGAGL